MKKRIIGIFIAILLGVSSFFICHNYVLANTTEEAKTEEVEKEEEKEENYQQENTYYTVDWEELDDYKIPFKSIWKAIKKELSKLKEVSFKKEFGNYNSFSEAVDMNKATIKNVCIGIVVLGLIVFIITRLFKKKK